MACKDPLKKCATTTPSGCVEWTGNLPELTYLCVDDCSISVNSLFLELDRNVTLLRGASTLPVQDVIEADTCHLLDLSNITNRDSCVTGDFVKISDLTKQLITTDCNQKEQIEIVHDGTKLNSEFFDLQLPENIQNMLRCLVCDQGCDPLYAVTLKDLFELIAKKIVDLPCKPCDPGCINC